MCAGRRQADPSRPCPALRCAAARLRVVPWRPSVPLRASARRHVAAPQHGDARQPVAHRCAASRLLAGARWPAAARPPGCAAAARVHSDLPRVAARWRAAPVRPDSGWPCAFRPAMARRTDPADPWQPDAEARCAEARRVVPEAHALLARWAAVRAWGQQPDHRRAGQEGLHGLRRAWRNPDLGLRQASLLPRAKAPPANTPSTSRTPVESLQRATRTSSAGSLRRPMHAGAVRAKITRRGATTRRCPNRSRQPCAPRTADARHPA